MPATENLPPAHEVNDLDRIAGLYSTLHVRRAWYDEAVHLHRHRPLRQPQVLDQTSNGEALGHVLGDAVHGDDHVGDFTALAAFP